MSNRDKKVNRTLADYLIQNHIKVTSGTHLDIGSKYPYLGYCFKEQGFESYNIDGIAAIHQYSKELGVHGYQLDFENQEFPVDVKFDIITLVHCIEHFYQPVETLKKITGLLKDTGVLFIRCPSAEVEGIERDLTAAYYEIHPVIYSESSMKYLLKQSGLHCYQTYSLRPGQRDYLIQKQTPFQVVNLARAGALGDVILTSTLIRGLRQKHPNAALHYYTRCPEAAKLIYGIDAVIDTQNWDKRVPGVDYLLYGYPHDEGYPQIPMKKHLIEYFAEDVGVKPGPFSLVSISQNLVKGDFITLHIKTGWSIYKEWSVERWSQTIQELRPYLGETKVVQIGSAQDPLVTGIDIDLRGKTSLEESCALIRDSVLHLGCDSFSNHIAGAYKKKAVILFGSTSPIGSGYSTATNIWTHEVCSPCYKENPEVSREAGGPCDHHSCMNKITVDIVKSAILHQLKGDGKMISKTICLGMIVKNEAHIIQRCLESVKPYIDYWVICDTGSTDGTQQLIRDCLRDIPGELIERPWVNFGHNRTEVFQYAKEKADYIWVIDADDYLVGSVDFSHLEKDVYSLHYYLGDLKYTRPQLFNNSLDWKYVGVVHEYADCSQVKTHEILLGEYWIQAGHEGSRNLDPNKYLKDALLLEAALTTDPHNTRYLFYLGQSYYSAGQYAQALEAYNKRIAVGGWEEEVFQAYYHRGQCEILLNKPSETIIETLLHAYHIRPTRAESLHALLKYCREHQLYYLGYMIGKFAQMIPLPTRDILFVEQGVYEYRILDEFAICAYWCGKYQDAYNAISKLLADNLFPESYRTRILENQQFTKNKMK